MNGRMWRWFLLGFAGGALGVGLIWLGVTLERSRWERGLAEVDSVVTGQTLSADSTLAPNEILPGGTLPHTSPAPIIPASRSITGVIEQASPAVVGITVTHIRSVRARNPLNNDPFFREFFRIPDQIYKERVENLGSGFILDADGYIITNEHVVNGANNDTEIMVTLPDGRSYNAELIGTDFDTDLALLKIDAHHLPVLPIAHTTDLQVGEWVISIGNPFGLFKVNDQPSVSVGVVSAMGRNFERQENGRLYVNMIQTDAAINPGNSGGPLLNLNGEAVGVNTFIFTGGGGSVGSVGIGFAIPAPQVREVAELLRTRGEVQRDVWIGIAAQNLSRLVAMSLNYPLGAGVIVTNVEADSPADKAGLQSTDILMRVNEVQITDFTSLNTYLRNHDLRVGDLLRFQVFRKGDSLTLDLILEGAEAMIERYTRPAMGAIWTDNGKYDSWLQVELAVVDAWTKRGVIPQEDRDAIHSGAGYNVDRINEIERTTHHDVIAFLTSVAEHVGPSSRWVHLGMTSSDMLDTALALQLKQAGALLLAGVDPLLEALQEKAQEHKMLAAIGRTHGVHAEPVAFGLRFARFYEQLVRGRERLQQAYDSVCTGKLSGAVGMYVHLDPEMEEDVMAALDLNTAPISSQIVSRDRHADFMGAIALIGTILESIALEVRHMQRTEVREAREGFAKGQKGSSAMPHKRNPINAEKICGMARLLRANMQAAYENVALWHERDISHSSVERVILPDSTIALDYLLSLTTRLVSNLVVDEERVREVLDLTRGAVFSEGLLLALVRAGLTREEGYALVQRIAHDAVDRGASVKDAALADSELVSRIGADEVEKVFDVEHALRHVDTIYRRLGLEA